MRLMKTTHHLNRAGLAQPFDAEYSQLHRNTPNLSTTGKRTFSAGETATFWFAVASPLIGLVIGFLGACLVTWLTNQ